VPPGAHAPFAPPPHAATGCLGSVISLSVTTYVNVQPVKAILVFNSTHARPIVISIADVTLASKLS